MASSRPKAFTFTQLGPYRLYSTAELLLMPPPEWLVEDTIPLGELSVAYAPPESFKSFIGLGVALSTASGIPWQGRPTKKGFTIYIAAEGISGLGRRALAWFTHHKVDPETADIAWLTESLAVTADSEALVLLLDRIEKEVQRTPVLIVIDTLARCFDGEESETGAMSQFVAGCDVLRHRFGCAVLVIHHTRMDGQRERGNTALRAGARAMLALEREDGSLVIRCDKMNDAEHFPDILLDFQRIDLGTDDKGKLVTSGVLVPSKQIAKHESEEDYVLDVLRTVGPTTWAEWKAATQYSESLFTKVYGRIAGKVIKDTSSPPLWRVL